MAGFPSYISANIQPCLKKPTGFLKCFFYFWLKKLMLFLFLAGFFKPFFLHGKTASCLLQTFKLAFWNVFFIPSLKFLSISCLSTGFSSYLQKSGTARPDRIPMELLTICRSQTLHTQTGSTASLNLPMPMKLNHSAFRMQSTGFQVRISLS